MTGPLASDHRSVRLGAIALGLVLGAAAMAQDRAATPEIPAEVLSAQSITPQHRQAITAFIDAHVASLRSDDQLAAASAMEALVERFEGASPAFVRAYSEAIGAALQPLMSDAKYHTRLAASIVASRLNTGHGVPVYLAGLRDEQPGVRYRAAKAIADVMDRRDVAQAPPFNENQQQELLQALREAMNQEPAEAVFGQMGRALSKLTVPAAFTESLNSLRQRAPAVLRQPQASLRLVGEMLDNLRLALNVRAAAGQDIQQPLRELTAVAGLYCAVLHDRLVKHGKEFDHGDLRLLEASEAIFRKAVEELATDIRPPAFLMLAQRGNWSDLAQMLIEWTGGRDPGILTTSAINVPREQLQLLPQE